MTLSVRSFQTPRHLAHLRLAAELAVGADLARHARHFRGEHAELLDHRVDDVGRAQELALQRTAVDVEPHGLQQIALRHRGDRARHLGGRPQQIVDQRVDRAFHLAPGAAADAEAHALAGLAFPADDLADALELLGHALVGGDDLVEGVGDLADDADLIARHPHREIADPHRLQRLQQFMNLAGGAAVHLADRRIGRRAGGRPIGLQFADWFIARLHGLAPNDGRDRASRGSFPIRT